MIFFLFYSPLVLSSQLEGATIELLGKTPRDDAYSQFTSKLITVEDENVISYQDPHRVLIGNRKWIKGKNFIDIPQDVEDKMTSQEKLGHTALLAAIDGKIFLSSEVFFDPSHPAILLQL